MLALRMMAQDTGVPAGGDDQSGGGATSGAPASPNSSGASGASSGASQGNSNGSTDQGNTNGSTNQGNTNGATDQGNPNGATDQGNPNGGTDQGNSNGGILEGTSTPAPTPGADQGGGDNGTGILMGPGTETPSSGDLLGPGTGEGSVLVPEPGTVAPVPGTTPAPTPAGPNSVSAGTEGAVQTAPVTFTLPGGYGGNAAQSFTLGEGRLAKPPITFTLSVSQGYDNNIFSADSHVVATPTPTPGPKPQQERRLIDYFIAPGVPLTPIFQFFSPKVRATPTPPPPLGVLGSPVSTATLSAQVQRGSPRTLFTADLSLGANDYWDRPGDKLDYNGNFGLSMIHRLSPRATLSLSADAVYQKTPDFALINAPTNNGNGGAYLNGNAKADLSYTWGQRFSTVTSYSIGFNLGNSNAQNNVYTITYGTQVRYTISARNTVTAELRASDGVYPSNAAADNDSIYYLLGLDTFFSAKLRNTISVGIETDLYSGDSVSQTIPYLESATTLALPRGGSLTWTNRVGSEDSGNAQSTSSSYRTGLTLSQPLSAKLVGSISLAYNYVKTTDDVSPSGSYTQNELQTSLSLAYNLSPRFSLSLSYTLTDLMTTQVNTSYQRQEVFLGGSYTFR